MTQRMMWVPRQAGPGPGPGPVPFLLQQAAWLGGGGTGTHLPALPTERFSTSSAGISGSLPILASEEGSWTYTWDVLHPSTGSAHYRVLLGSRYGGAATTVADLALSYNAARPAYTVTATITISAGVVYVIVSGPDGTEASGNAAIADARQFISANFYANTKVVECIGSGSKSITTDEPRAYATNSAGQIQRATFTDTCWLGPNGDKTLEFYYWGWPASSGYCIRGESDGIYAMEVGETLKIRMQISGIYYSIYTLAEGAPGYIDLQDGSAHRISVRASVTDGYDLFVDGVLQSHLDYPGGYSGVLSQNYVDLGSALGVGTDSLVGDVRIWNTARTNQEILANRQFGVVSGSHPDLWSLWRFDHVNGSNNFPNEVAGQPDMVVTTYDQHNYTTRMIPSPGVP